MTQPAREDRLAFEDLTDAEMAELESRDWTEAQIVSAISMALKEGAMQAVVDLLARLTKKNPRKANLILEMIALTAALERDPTPPTAEADTSAGGL